MKQASVTFARAGAPSRWRMCSLPLGLETVALVGVVGLALALRLVGIAQDTDVSDEGIRGLQLRLMSAGFRPMSEIYASQGPLSLVLFYPLYRLFGADIVAARLAVVLYSIVSLLAVFWLGRRLAGPIGGLAAAALLAISPVFLGNSRLALVEIPSLAPGLLAIAALLRYRNTGLRRWLVTAAMLLAIATLAKPMAAVVGAAALVLIAAPRGRAQDVGAGASSRTRFADLALYGAVGLAAVALVAVLIGPSVVYEQLVNYRLAARTARGWDLAANWSIVRTEFGREGLGLLILGGVGAAAAVRARPVLAYALLAWLASGLVLVVFYSPLWPKHLVYLLPPLALLAGAAVAQAVGAVPQLVTRRRPSPMSLGALAAVLVYLIGLPSLAEQDRRLLARTAGDDPERYVDDVRVARAASGLDDFIVMDDAYLALATDRLVPPYLVDLSWNRILARALTADRAIAETDRFDAKALVIQDDHLGQLSRYLTWADREYLLVKSYLERKPDRFRRVYVHPDIDLAPVRDALAAGIQTPMHAELGPVALRGYTVERRDLKPGLRFALTFHWESLVEMPPEHHLVVRFRRPDGQVEQQSTWKIGDGAQELDSWSAGRWQFQTIRLPVEDQVQPGTYLLTVALDAPGGGQRIPRNVRGASTTASGSELQLGTVTVR
jgi:hypothetical protein